MLTFIQLGFFYLYFPENKMEYIPVVIEFVVLVIACIFLFKWLKRKSAKDAIKAKEIEDRVMKAKKEQAEK